MKTVITATGNTKDSGFDVRFGRAGWFCLMDNDTSEIEFIENPNVMASNGAGTKAAELIISKQATKVISGDFGPKAKELLDKFNVQMVTIENDNYSIQDVINKIK